MRRSAQTYRPVLFFKERFRKKHGRKTTGRVGNTEDEGIDMITRLYGQVMPKEIPESTEWRAAHTAWPMSTPN